MNTKTKPLSTREFIETGARLSTDLEAFCGMMREVAAMAAEHDLAETSAISRLARLHEGCTRLRGSLINDLFPLLAALQRLNDKTPE